LPKLLLTLALCAQLIWSPSAGACTELNFGLIRLETKFLERDHKTLGDQLSHIASLIGTTVQLTRSPIFAKRNAQLMPQALETLRELDNKLQEIARDARSGNQIEFVRMALNHRLTIAPMILELRYPGNSYQTVYHYTSVDVGTKNIFTSGRVRLLASQPAREGNPSGVYFTSLSPTDIGADLGRYKDQLGLTREKKEFVVIIRLPKSDIEKHTSGDKDGRPHVRVMRGAPGAAFDFDPAQAAGILNPFRI
jgi:hypothetical protein